MDQLINEPTRTTLHSQSLLDVMLTTNKERICDSCVLCHSMSDHSAIYCIYRSAVRSQASSVAYRDMKHFCANHFRCDLHKVPSMVCEVFDDVDRLLVSKLPCRQRAVSQVCQFYVILQTSHLWGSPKVNPWTTIILHVCV